MTSSSESQIPEALKILIQQYQDAQERNGLMPEYPLGIFLLGFITLVLVNTSIGNPEQYHSTLPPHKLASMLANLGLPGLQDIVAKIPDNLAFDEDQHKLLFEQNGGGQIETLIAAAKTSTSGFSQETLVRAEQVITLLRQVFGETVAENLLKSALPLTTFAVANDVMQYCGPSANELAPMFKPGIDSHDEEMARIQAFNLLSKTVGHQRPEQQKFWVKLATATSVYAVEPNAGVVSTEEAVFELRPLDENELTVLIWGMESGAGLEAYSRLSFEKQHIFIDHATNRRGTHWDPVVGYNIAKLRGVNGAFKVDDPLIVDLMAVSLNGVVKTDKQFDFEARKARLLASGHTSTLPYMMAMLIQQRWNLAQAEPSIPAVAVSSLDIPVELQPFISGDWQKVSFSNGAAALQTLQWFSNLVKQGLSATNVRL